MKELLHAVTALRVITVKEACRNHAIRVIIRFPDPQCVHHALLAIGARLPLKPSVLRVATPKQALHPVPCVIAGGNFGYILFSTLISVTIIYSIMTHDSLRTL